MGTRTLLTTPVGTLPADDPHLTERWSAGPRLPVEPGPPPRFVGLAAMAATLAVVVGLTLLIAPLVVAEPQDPTFGGDAPVEQPSG